MNHSSNLSSMCQFLLLHLFKTQNLQDPLISSLSMKHGNMFDSKPNQKLSLQLAQNEPNHNQNQHQMWWIKHHNLCSPKTPPALVTPLLLRNRKTQNSRLLASSKHHPIHRVDLHLKRWDLKESPEGKCRECLFYKIIGWCVSCKEKIWWEKLRKKLYVQYIWFKGRKVRDKTDQGRLKKKQQVQVEESFTNVVNLKFQHLWWGIWFAFTIPRSLCNSKLRNV